jgi:hypothetical protein
LLPKFPIQTSFDPAKSDYSQELWSLPAGRILMLLWRPTHLCSPDWWKDALRIAKKIEAERPASIKALFQCFDPFRTDSDFTREDVKEFCAEALDFFTSKRHVPYEGVVSGNASMIRKD